MSGRRGKAGTVRAVPAPGTGQTFAEAALNRSSTTDPLLPCFRRHPQARLVVDGALARRESRGGHFRTDYPELAPPARAFVRLPAAAMIAAG